MSNKIGKIYKIFSSLSSEIYIGSTFSSLKDRWYSHRSSYNTYKKNGQHKLSVHDIFDKYNIKNFQIMLIKEYEVCDKNHLEAFEQLWINKSQNCINKLNTLYVKKFASKNYYKENKDGIITKTKEYYKKNKIEIRDKMKKNYDKNKHNYKDTQTKYYEKNKDKIKNRRREYYQKNRDKQIQQVKLNRSIIINCECGETVTKRSLCSHKKSQKHINYHNSIM